MNGKNCGMLPPEFFPLEELAGVIARHKSEGKTVVLANGGFDLLHVGHVRYLQEAKTQADILVVALNSDMSLRRLKGRDRALIVQEDRVRILSSLACVDYVTLFDEDRADRVLSLLKPDVHCKGSDYSIDTVPERDIVKSYGGRIVIAGGGKVRSTSEIIRALREKDLP